MNFKNLCVAIFSSLLMLGQVHAQHSDIEFGYEGGGIIFEADETGFDAAGLFESEFESVDMMTGAQTAEDPGFASNFMEMGESFSVSTGDSVFVNVNASATFGGFITYFNPATDNFEPTSSTFTIEDNSPMLTTDLVISQNSLSGDLNQFITTSAIDPGTGEQAEIDSHVDFILSGGAQDGVYGLLLNIHSDNLSGDLTAVDSDPFWVLFNSGLTEEVFENSIGNFQAIPEPSAMVVLALASVVAVRRRRKF